jgi:hypothetical protein
MNVPSAEIQSIRCQSRKDEKTHYYFERPEKRKAFEMVQFPKGERRDESAFKQLSGALDAFYMENIADPSESSPAKMSDIIEYRLFNGLIYRIMPSDTCLDDDRCYLKIEVDYQKPPVLKKKTGEAKNETGKKDQEGKKAQEDLLQKAQKLNQKFKPWTYVIPRWKRDAFITDVTQLIEKKEDQKDK